MKKSLVDTLLETTGELPPEPGMPLAGSGTREVDKWFQDTERLDEIIGKIRAEVTSGERRHWDMPFEKYVDERMSDMDWSDGIDYPYEFRIFLGLPEEEATDAQAAQIDAFDTKAYKVAKQYILQQIRQHRHIPSAAAEPPQKFKESTMKRNLFNITESVNKKLDESEPVRVPGVVRYSFDLYPRQSQKPVGACKIIEDWKNQDACDTWGGVLEGPLEDVAKTLSAWGNPEISITLHPLSLEEAKAMIIEDQDGGE